MTCARPSAVTAAFVALVAGSFGCTRQAFSPPSRALPIETPQALDQGKTGLSGELSHSGALFGPNVFAGAGRVRHGLGQEVEGSVEATVLRVSAQNDEKVGTDPNIYAARAGAKLQLARWFAVSGGFGGGRSAAGGFVSPDMALIGGWENRWVIPFLTLRGFTSHPLGARSVYLGEGVYDKPRLTLGFAWALGVKVPLVHAERWEQAPPLAIGVALGQTHLFEGRHNETFTGLSSALEIVL